MEINVTKFVFEEDASQYSASQAELGENAGQITWGNAKNGLRLLNTPQEFDALRDHIREYGAWEDEEIDGWSDQECNALMVQEVSAAMREAGVDDCDPDEFDWEEYERKCEEGTLSGRLYRGDDGQVYFYLGS